MRHVVRFVRSRLKYVGDGRCIDKFVVMQVGIHSWWNIFVMMTKRKTSHPTARLDIYMCFAKGRCLEIY